MTRLRRANRTRRWIHRVELATVNGAMRDGEVASSEGLIVPFLPSAFGVFLLRPSRLGFPDELHNATRTDGANVFSAGKE
jgi:hypothetical protein